MPVLTPNRHAWTISSSSLFTVSSSWRLCATIRERYDLDNGLCTHTTFRDLFRAVDLEECTSAPSYIRDFLRLCFDPLCVWFLFYPLYTQKHCSYVTYLIIAEVYAYGVEMIWYKLIKAEHPIRLSCVANTTSFLTGLLLHHFDVFWSLKTAEARYET